MTDEEIVDYVRLRLGNVSTVVLPDTTILVFLYQNQAIYTDEATIIYYTILNSVDFLIAYYTAKGNSTRRMQQEGGVMVDLQGTNYVGSWQDWRKNFLKQPNIDGLTLANVLPVVIGGVSKAEVARVNNRADSNYKGYRLGTFFD